MASNQRYFLRIFSESESQMEKNNAGQWKTQHQAPLGSSEESGDSKRVPLDPNAGPFFQTLSSAPMGPIIASEIHPDLAHGCSPMWNHGMEMLLQPRSYMIQNPIQEETTTAESPFYSPPETCASPSSDGTTFDLSPIPSSSVLPDPITADVGRAPEFMLKSGLPLQSDFRCWAMCGGDLLESSTTPVSLDGDIINPVSWQSKSNVQYLQFD